MKYPKIQSLWKRDPNTGLILPGQYAREEFASIYRWHVTEKIDGTNIRIMWDGKDVTIGGRTDRAQIPAHLVNRLNELFCPQKLGDVFGVAPVVLFGEGYGRKIQKPGTRYSETAEFSLFDAVVDGRWWLKQNAITEIAEKLGIRRAPIIRSCDVQSEIVKIVEDGFFSRIAQDPTLPAEGIIARSYPLMMYRGHGGPIMWKLKTSDYRKLEAAQEIQCQAAA